MARAEVPGRRALHVLQGATGEALGYRVIVRFFFSWYLTCALLTWMALVADRPARFIRPRAFASALRLSVQHYGGARVALWAILCLVAWWVVLIAWSTDLLRPRP